MRDLQAARRASLTFIVLHDSRTRARLIMVGLAGSLLALDQWTKHLAVVHLDPRDPPTYLGGFFKLLLVRNPGAAFSLGTSATVVLSVLALVVLIVLLGVIAPRVHSLSTAIVTGLGIAGVGGNFTDRMLREPSPFRGHVIDFLSFGTFPVFNVADMCLTTGAALMILLSLRQPDPKAGAQADAEAGDSSDVTQPTTTQGP